MSEPVRVTRAINDVWCELRRALDLYGPMASAHEGYAVLLEEVDELWDEVKLKPAARSTKKMRAEAVQVAAMAIRFMLDVCEKGDTCDTE